MDATTGPMWIDETEMETLYHVTKDGGIDALPVENGAVVTSYDGRLLENCCSGLMADVFVGGGSGGSGTNSGYVTVTHEYTTTNVSHAELEEPSVGDAFVDLQVSPTFSSCPLPPAGPTLCPPSVLPDVEEDVAIQQPQQEAPPTCDSATTDASPSSPAAAVPSHFVVVAVDFGTALSGYAFAFVRDPGSSIHMMRRWEGGDPGVVNQKTPTTLLLSPEGAFHSFGYAARDFYHDLDAEEAKRWLYFDKFKMALHYNSKLNRDTTITAANGKPFPALVVFAHALRYFRDHAVQELGDQSSTTILDSDIRWVITVPAIWKAQAKQFMRQAAIQAGMTSDDHPERLLIALEPEAASIYVRKLRLYQLVPDSPVVQPLSPYSRDRDSLDGSSRNSFWADDYAAKRRSQTLPREMRLSENGMLMSCEETVGGEVELEGTRYIVVDCGGGTVDITVHEMDSAQGRLHEVYKATGGPYGSVGVDTEFERLLINIFGADFIDCYKQKRPSGWIDLMIAFESRKRSANPFKNHPLNVCLPFSFIEQYKKYRGHQVENAINKYGDKEIRWSSQGMIRLSLDAMKRLFNPTVERIKQSIANVLNTVPDLGYMFLVGGFAESPLLQQEIRSAFGKQLKILIPQDVALTVLKGAVCFGLDPTVVTLRRSRLTYGVEVLNRFNPDKHPQSKLVRRDNVDWCREVFDVFVRADQEVAPGETIVRRYAPAGTDQTQTIINIYSTERSDVAYVTDDDVTRCGRLHLDMSGLQPPTTTETGTGNGDDPRRRRRREIQTTMTFGDTEIGVSALDVASGKCVRACVDFLGDF